MMKKILITGGAGFIGSHLADELLLHNYEVRVLDNLCGQVHGTDCARPEYLHPEVELMCGDVRDPETLAEGLRGVDAVFHFAARVGVGQSMYEVAEYTSVNNQGTAALLQALIQNPVAKLVVASSMSLYGEGLYKSARGELVPGTTRTLSQLKNHDWELRGKDGIALTPVPTPETKVPSLASVYALSKYDQEQLCLIIGQAYNIPTVALRFFNVYGPRQALSNPYTGVMAIFASRLMNNKSPMIFEDGLQQRDFVSVYDVARACRLALEVPEAAGRVFNVGSGEHYTILELAQRVCAAMGREFIEPEITGKYRMGDIRHCFADISLARSILGFEPKVAIAQGLEELVTWLEGQAAEDKVEQASAELTARGLTV
ncbi:MAG TPA: NAD-dependent epimerase/dehydratase family protein [Candidatus Saccharimonadales bacterium]|nr:NAD-dependent epimerase/dehydratase family protein [Candidatus Saccharimonadales bacterium]